MVFLGNDRKSLHIYTASVIGGCKDIQDNETYSGDMCSTSYVSQLYKLQGFRMKFDFVVRGNDNNDVISIESKDLTSGEQDFLSQIEYIRQVWGEECEVIYNDQAKLDEKLKQYLPDLEKQANEPNETVSIADRDDEARSESWKITPAQTAALARQKILYICDEKKIQEREMCSLALPGGFQRENYYRPTERKKREKVAEGSEHASYCIEIPQNVELVPGIELVNWVKTTICFRYKFQESNLNFCIQKESRVQDDVQYIAPDFTWYFSPPVKSFIDNESSSVEIKLFTGAENSIRECKYRNQLNQNLGNCSQLNCTCPIRKLDVWDHTTKRYPNVINPVANKTTVNFKQWTKDEMIGYRQKYRLAVKNIFTQSVTFDSVNEINIFLDTTDEHGRGNRQFVLSIFISFALAFGIDSTRLSQATVYFPFTRILTADAGWLLLLGLLTLNMLIRPPRAEKERFYCKWRSLNLVGTLIWVLYVFIVSKSEILQIFLGQWELGIKLFIQFSYCLVVASNILYVYKNTKKYHDPILSGLFDDDIL